MRTQAPVVLFVGNLTGLACIVLAWFGASSEVDAHAQRPWVLIAAAGLTIATLVDGLTLGALRRRTDLRRRAIVASVELVVRRSMITVVDSYTDSHEPVSGPRMTWYHRRSCPLMRGKDIVAQDAPARRGRLACRTCRPDGGELA